MTRVFYFYPDPFLEDRWVIAAIVDGNLLVNYKPPTFPEHWVEVWKVEALWESAIQAFHKWKRNTTVPPGFENVISWEDR